ncbi:hypothetical protein [Acidithiobacillus sp.]|uniref:hypothetical protein n=1 Tax=Acidithiobacillus sp. TaxID=1872118 RepID=UPI0035628524
MTLHTDKLSTLEQQRAFADGTQARSFQASSRQEAYDCIADTLRRFHYERAWRFFWVSTPPCRAQHQQRWDGNTRVPGHRSATGSRCRGLPESA